MPDLSMNATRLVNAELNDGEHVVWSAAPDSKRVILRTLPAVVFGIPWTTFSVFWIYKAAGIGTRNDLFNSVFALFGLPFVLVGLAMLLSPYFAIRMARESAYVITNRRALVFKSGLFGRVSIDSFSPSQLENVSRTQHADGTGDVHFVKAVSHGPNNVQVMRMAGFFGVEDAKAVEDLIVKLSKSVHAPAA